MDKGLGFVGTAAAVAVGVALAGTVTMVGLALLRAVVGVARNAAGAAQQQARAN